MAQRSTNTMVEMLQRFLSDIAQAKTALDADLPFLLQLESMVLGKLRDPNTQMQQAGLLPPDGSQSPAGASPAMLPPGMGGGGMPPGMQAGGLAPAAMMPNMDEMRRQLA